MSRRDDFFIGWAGRLPAAHAGFLRGAVASVLCAFLLLGLALARSLDDPGGGTDVGGEQALRGVLTALPYPTLTLAGDHATPAGHTILLTGGGKIGPEFDPSLDGATVIATGTILRRGALEMLQVSEPLRRADTALPAPIVTQLGVWRITGEICDGKCYAGSMRPGTGLAHRACANLCVAGGVPPVFVATGAIEGATHLLLGDPRGGALADRFRDLTALRVRLDGRVERRGDLLVFLPDLRGAVVP